MKETDEYSAFDDLLSHHKPPDFQYDPSNPLPGQQAYLGESANPFLASPFRPLPRKGELFAQHDAYMIHSIEQLIPTEEKMISWMDVEGIAITLSERSSA